MTPPTLPQRIQQIGQLGNVQQRPDVSGVGTWPPFAYSDEQRSVGPDLNVPQTPPPSLWDKIQHLPFIGRDASDQFRADIGQTWQALKERMGPHTTDTPIPYLGLALGASNLTPLGEDLSPVARKTLQGVEDFAAGRNGLLPKFAIMSADREGLAPEVLAERHAELLKRIRAAGFEPIEHNGGVWRNDAGKLIRERGVIVPGMSASQAQHIGESFGQQAVITNEGYHDIQAGTTAPLTGMRAPKGREPYTVMPSGRKLAMDFDFQRAQPNAYARGAGKGLPTPPLERIAAPSVRGVDGEYYTGANHGEAANNAADAIRAKPGGLELIQANRGNATVRGSEGFKTSTGRYIDRNEARELSTAASQTNASAYAQLHSSDLPQTGPKLPEGAPSVLGASEPKYAYRDPTGTRHGLPLAEEDVAGLGVAGRHLLQDFPDKEGWLEEMKRRFPSYAPHLNGWAGDRAFAVANRAKLPTLPPFEDIERLARSETGESTRPWYHSWWPAVSRAFGNDDGEMLTRFHAVLSAQKSPEDNAIMSLHALEDYKAGNHNFESVGTTPERVQALRRIAEAGPQGEARIALEGRKVNNFYLALRGSPEAVVLDRHMARAYLGRENISPAEYDALDARVRSDAQESGVSPRDYQAMVWGGQTKYPFEPPENFLWQHMSSGMGGGDYYAFPKGMDHRIPQIKEELTRYNMNRAKTVMPQAPTHAAIKVGDHVFEVPMNRGHAGALEKAIESLREPGFGPDEIMQMAEDGYTHGDGKFIPRAAVEHLHSSDFVRAKRNE